jgi:glutamyl-tRNA reductase
LLVGLTLRHSGAKDRMQIILLGANHRTAAVEPREKLAFTERSCLTSLGVLLDRESIREGLILSTCNRVEVLTVTEAGAADRATNAMRALLSERGLFSEELDSCTYVHVDEEAVTHLFRVAASLDSMVVGEPQILGQVRKAYSLAIEAGTAGDVLNKLLPHAFRAAKRVRNETDIAGSAVSVSYAAVELGRKIFHTLSGKTVLLIGAGETAELAARHLVKAGVERVLVANRTDSHAQQLVQKFGGEVVDFDNLVPSLAAADLVLCSTSAPDYIVTAADANHATSLRNQRPLVFIDLSVPRNIDPQISGPDNVFVFDIDDLQKLIESNLGHRLREADRAEAIVQQEVMRFTKDLRTREFGQVIGGVAARMQQIAQAQLVYQRSRLGPLTPAQEEAIESLLISTVNKLAHPVMSELRKLIETGAEQNAKNWLEMLDRDFQRLEG